MTTLTLSKALNAGLRKALEDDPKVLVMGEDVGKLGGVFRVTDGLQKDFGESRVVDTPLAESGIVGTAIGLALRGSRPVCEVQFDGSVFHAFDPIRWINRQHLYALGKFISRVIKQLTLECAACCQHRDFSGTGCPGGRLYCRLHTDKRDLRE